MLWCTWHKSGIVSSAAQRACSDDSVHHNLSVDELPRRHGHDFVHAATQVDILLYHQQGSIPDCKVNNHASMDQGVFGHAIL
jgi:hypothetical protein